MHQNQTVPADGMWCGTGQELKYKTLCSMRLQCAQLSMANSVAIHQSMHQNRKFMNEPNLYTLGMVRFWYAALRSTICDVLVTRAKRFDYIFLSFSFRFFLFFPPLSGRAATKGKINHVHTFTVLIQWRAMRENTWKYKILQEKEEKKKKQSATAFRKYARFM